MKKVKVLFSALAVVALAAGMFAAKANVDDIVYTFNSVSGRCDIPVEATLFAHGDPIATKLVTLTPDAPAPTGNCTVQSLYQKI